MHRTLVLLLSVSFLLGSGPAHAQDAEVQKWIEKLGTAEDKQFTALNKLIALGEKSIKPALALLKDKKQHSGRRWQAAKLLGALKAKEAIPALLDAVTDENWAVGALSAEALGRIGDKMVIPKLRERLKKVTHDRVKTQIEVALARLEDRKPKLPKPAPKADPFSLRFKWAPSPKEGLARAKKDGQLLLTLVYAHENMQPTGHMDRSEVPYHALLRGPFTDPDLTQLLRDCFVMTRVSMHIHGFSEDRTAMDPDPLVELGSSGHAIDPPAIMIHDENGKLLHVLSGIGVFDARSIRAMLVGTLKKTGKIPKPGRKKTRLMVARAAYLEGRDQDALKTLNRGDGRVPLAGKILHHIGNHQQAVEIIEIVLKKTVDAETRGEMLYLQADSEVALGNHERARQLFQRLKRGEPQTVWSHKASERLNPQALDLYLIESYGFVDRDSAATATSTEARLTVKDLPDVISRSSIFLLRVQHEDGSWRTGINPLPNFDIPAITAIVTAALHDWAGDLQEPLKTQVLAAASRGRDFILRYAEQPGRNPFHVFNHTYALELVLDLWSSQTLKTGRPALEKAARELVAALQAIQYPGGGWSYMELESGKKTYGGERDHSFNTGPILEQLARARKAGIKPKTVVMKRGVEALKTMRSKDGAFVYANPKGFQWMTRHRAAIARDCCCELGLLATAEKPDPSALVTAVKRFHEHRLDLEIPRKLYSSYFNSNGHGSYFYTFAYFYAAKALAHAAPEARKKMATDLMADLLRIVEKDATWIDSHATGKAYATGMALRALKRLHDARRAQ